MSAQRRTEPADAPKDALDDEGIRRHSGVGLRKQGAHPLTIGEYPEAEAGAQTTANEAEEVEREEATAARAPAPIAHLPTQEREVLLTPLPGRQWMRLRWFALAIAVLALIAMFAPLPGPPPGMTIEQAREAVSAPAVDAPPKSLP